MNEEELRNELHRHAIEYIRLEGLGGLRHTTKTSISTAWKNASFRGYADYMQTLEFARAVGELIDLAKEKRIECFMTATNSVERRTFYECHK